MQILFKIFINIQCFLSVKVIYLSEIITYQGIPNVIMDIGIIWLLFIIILIVVVVIILIWSRSIPLTSLLLIVIIADLKWRWGQKCVFNSWGHNDRLNIRKSGGHRLEDMVDYILDRVGHLTLVHGKAVIAEQEVVGVVLPHLLYLGDIILVI